MCIFKRGVGDHPSGGIVPPALVVFRLSGVSPSLDLPPGVLRCGKRSWSCFLFDSVRPLPHPDSQEVVGDLTLVVEQVFRLGAVGVAWREKKRRA